MRIISGKYKGKRLSAPKKLPVRPTTDMAKEGLFNILSNRYYFEDISVLDLFAGTGNISFEFSSRGCMDVTSVDAHAGCVQYISKTSRELDFAIQTLKTDVFKLLERCKTKFDIIFADPPYNLENEKFLLLVQLVFSRQLLKKEGLLIVEHAPQTDLSDTANFTEKRKYGSSVFSFFGNLENNNKSRL